MSAAPSSSSSAVTAVLVPVSSPHDPRAYRHCTLANGLEALLVNDKPKSQQQPQRTKQQPQPQQSDAGDSGSSGEKPACVALSVRVGSWSDPAAIPGLAHFLEHMLFMGNAKYPSENEWEEFLAEHGGSSNAWTDAEHTTYYFEINHRYLHEALQRFSHFFLTPLFAPSATKREIRAVDSEFRDCLNSDPERLSELVNHTAALVNPAHPFAKWGWGSMDSLETNIKKHNAALAAAAASNTSKGQKQQQQQKGKQGAQKGKPLGKGGKQGGAAASSGAAVPGGIDLRAELKAFHARWYSSHAMRLVVYDAVGKLDRMESWVAAEFAQIKHNGLPLQDFPHC